jgi:hypothetical protein
MEPRSKLPDTTSEKETRKRKLVREIRSPSLLELLAFLLESLSLLTITKLGNGPRVEGKKVLYWCFTQTESKKRERGGGNEKQKTSKADQGVNQRLETNDVGEGKQAGRNYVELKASKFEFRA